jgi:hypothetical protein
MNELEELEDERIELRHEKVLQSMRNNWTQLQKLRLELKHGILFDSNGNPIFPSSMLESGLLIDKSGLSGVKSGLLKRKISIESSYDPNDDGNDQVGGGGNSFVFATPLPAAAVISGIA